MLASLGVVAAGGLGARSTAEHVPAAYVASLAQSQELCAGIWPGFDEYDIDGGPLRADTESSLTASMQPNANIHGSSDTPSQKSLSAKIEARVCQHLLDPSSKERHRLAHFVHNRVPGPGLGSLLSLTPGLQLLTLRAGVGQVWGEEEGGRGGGRDHALACGCGGDWVSRHNLIRDVVHSAANDRANLATVLEKPGLLIPRDPSDEDRPTTGP